MEKRYERPEVLATYSVRELVAEAAVCVETYPSGSDD
jgi:hypothetical protein